METRRRKLIIASLLISVLFFTTYNFITLRMEKIHKESTHKSNDSDEKDESDVYIENKVQNKNIPRFIDKKYENIIVEKKLPEAKNFLDLKKTNKSIVLSIDKNEPINTLETSIQTPNFELNCDNSKLILDCSKNINKTISKNFINSCIKIKIKSTFDDKKLVTIVHNNYLFTNIFKNCNDNIIKNILRKEDYDDLIKNLQKRLIPQLNPKKFGKNSFREYSIEIKIINNCYNKKKLHQMLYKSKNQEFMILLNYLKNIEECNIFKTITRTMYKNFNLKYFKLKYIYKDYKLQGEEMHKKNEKKQIKKESYNKYPYNKIILNFGIKFKKKHSIDKYKFLNSKYFCKISLQKSMKDKHYKEEILNIINNKNISKIYDNCIKIDDGNILITQIRYFENNLEIYDLNAINLDTDYLGCSFVFFMKKYALFFKDRKIALNEKKWLTILFDKSTDESIIKHSKYNFELNNTYNSTCHSLKIASDSFNNLECSEMEKNIHTKSEPFDNYLSLKDNLLDAEGCNDINKSTFEMLQKEFKNQEYSFIEIELGKSKDDLLHYSNSKAHSLNTSDKNEEEDEFNTKNSKSQVLNNFNDELSLPSESRELQNTEIGNENNIKHKPYLNISNNLDVAKYIISKEKSNQLKEILDEEDKQFFDHKNGEKKNFYDQNYVFISSLHINLILLPLHKFLFFLQSQNKNSYFEYFNDYLNIQKNKNLLLNVLSIITHSIFISSDFNGNITIKINHSSQLQKTINLDILKNIDQNNIIEYYNKYIVSIFSYYIFNLSFFLSNKSLVTINEHSSFINNDQLLKTQLKKVNHDEYIYNEQLKIKEYAKYYEDVGKISLCNDFRNFFFSINSVFMIYDSNEFSTRFSEVDANISVESIIFSIRNEKFNREIEFKNPKESKFLIKILKF